MESVRQAYRAAWVRVEPTVGPVETLGGGGGGLAQAFAELGHEPLLVALAAHPHQAVELEDGGILVRAAKEGAVARLQVLIDGKPAADEVWPLPAAERGDLAAALADPDQALCLVEGPSGPRWVDDAHPGAARLGAARAEDLGDPSFQADHGVKLNYIAGAMAGGIASPELVAAMAKAGLLAFYGAGGLPVEAIQGALRALRAQVGDRPYGANLLSNPAEPAVEERTVDLYLGEGVRRASASAYLRPSDAVVRYRTHGIHLDDAGRVVAPNAVFAKISRVEVASHFLRPPPREALERLVAAGALTEAQARWATQIPLATEVTAEADSGGHTDHRPLPVLLPEILRLRDRAQREFGWAQRPRVGAAGGLGTPLAVWSAFAAGADYVLTGSVNQATLEAGTSTEVKELLLAAKATDVATGPAPDMFEMGARVQVLSRGALYAQRAQKLYDLYKAYPGLDELPADELGRLETQVFKRRVDEIWQDTVDYWSRRDPAMLEKARNPKVKMALVFRWYLGMTSRWARTGEADRKRDYQIWCGPAMGAFNEWVAGTWLEPLQARSVVHVAWALMRGAALEGRLAAARWRGLRVPVAPGSLGPLPPPGGAAAR
jgi:PfaD family protein